MPKDLVATSRRSQASSPILRRGAPHRRTPRSAAIWLEARHSVRDGESACRSPGQPLGDRQGLHLDGVLVGRWSRPPSLYRGYDQETEVAANGLNKVDEGSHVRDIYGLSPPLGVYGHLGGQPVVHVSSDVENIDLPVDPRQSSGERVHVRSNNGRLRLRQICEDIGYAVLVLRVKHLSGHPI